MKSLEGHEYHVSLDGEGYVHNDDCKVCAADERRLADLQAACGVNEPEASDESIS